MLEPLSSFTKSMTFIDSQFEHVLNNEIIIYDTPKITSQIVAIIKEFLEI